MEGWREVGKFSPCEILKKHARYGTNFIRNEPRLELHCVCRAKSPASEDTFLREYEGFLDSAELQMTPESRSSTENRSLRNQREVLWRAEKPAVTVIDTRMSKCKRHA